MSRLSPARILVLGFLGLSTIGALILMMPVCQSSGEWGSFIDMFFTATSAVCVTGLIVQDTSTFFTRTGQVVIMILIQLGGLGYMTAASIIFMILGKRMGFRDLLTLKYGMGAPTIGSAKKLLVMVFKIVVIVEFVGFAILCYPFIKKEGIVEGGFYALFHSISAFNNAGFSVYSDNLVGFKSDPVVLSAVSLLVVIGGIGFFVIYESLTRRFRDFSLHSKLALITTAILIVAGMIGFWLFEALAPTGEFAQMTVWEKILNSMFASVTPRTAGFNTFDYGKLHESTLVFTIVLMIIGASPGGTGGGIKTTTFAITTLSSFSTFLEKLKTIVFGRKLEASTIITAYSMLFWATIALCASTTLMLFIEKCDAHAALFECASALGTVGLSMGLTPQLSVGGKILIIVLMFIGRVGPITFGLAMFHHDEKGNVKYPIEDVLVG